ncbi:hypothetical protein MKX07_002868 [Trichoderma sp. CBMAI-0711]|nr:hypothetical protein MKX07_002868 [Trichoderma sp. CBMAI-0711]
MADNSLLAPPNIRRRRQRRGQALRRTTIPAVAQIKLTSTPSDISSQTLQSNARLLAAYLGFDTVTQLYIFADFEVPMVLTQLLGFYVDRGQPLPRHRRPTGHQNASCIISQAYSVWGRFGELQQRWPHRKDSLDGRKPSQVMVLPGFRFVDEDDVSTAVPDYSLSLLSACYKLMKSHPLRFCHSGSLEPEEYVWGIHHEDWMRAHAVIVFTITRQLTIEGIAQSCRGTSVSMKFGSPYHMSLDSEIYGYVASEESAAGGHLLRDPAHDAIETQLMSRRATNEEIDYVLRDIVTWRSKSDFERLSILQDPWGALVEVVTDAVCVTLDLITPSIDWQLDMDGPRVPSNSAPMNRQQLLHLKTWLKEQMQQQHCDKGVSAEYGDILPLSTANPGLDRSREMDAWLGYSPRFNEESLFDICERRGSGVYDIATEKELQAPHISDANQVAQLLGGPLRCAMLFSQCGTGKTRVMLLAIKFLIEENYSLSELGPFKPNVIIMPLAKFGTSVRELEVQWHDVFDIWVLCRPMDGIQFTHHKTIDSAEEFQQHIDEWAARRRDKEVARILLLASYESWLEFLPVSKGSQQLASQASEANVCWDAQKERKLNASIEPLWNVVALDECQILQGDAHWEAIEGISLDRLISTGSEINSEAYENLTEWQKVQCEQFRLYVLIGCGPAYLLHPELFRDLEVPSRRSVAPLGPVTRQILDMISVRRGMYTPMTLPDGRVTCLGEGVGRLAVRTIELMPPESVKQGLHESMSQSVGYMSMALRLIQNLHILQEGVLRHPISIETTGGLEWLFYNTRESRSQEFPLDRLSQVNQAEIDRAARVFNHKFSPYTCLVTTFQALGLGVSLHEFCRRGIIVELPQNYGMLLSAMGRLWRVGQERDVEWEILVASYSFDPWLEAGITEQYAELLGDLGGIDEAIEGRSRRLAAFEIIREQLGQEYSRYHRAEGRWEWSADAPIWRHKGLFESALGRFCLKHPEKAHLMQPRTVDALLRVWKIGMEITLEMVEELERS